MDPELCVTYSPTSNELDELRQRLVEFNTSEVGPSDYKAILVSFRGEDGKLLGGIAGHAYFEWLFLEMMWVDESLRGQGIGRKLMNTVEAEGRRLGCRHSWLDTFSFQAREFHERGGYSVFSELEDYPRGHSRFYMRKSLDAASAKLPLSAFAIDDYFYGLLTGNARYALMLSAYDLGLAPLLARGPMDADTILLRLRLDSHRGKKWLHALNLAGLLEHTHAGYRNSEGFGALFARNESSWFYREFLRYYRASCTYDLVDVLRGAPVKQTVHYPPQDPADVELLHLWMRNTAITTLQTIVTHVDFTKVRKLLDVAGGDGTMATLLAQKYPSLAITIFNIPAAVEMAKARIAQTGTGSRVDTVAGDFRHHQFPGGNEMVMFSRVMADWSPEVCRMLMIKSHAALKPGGKLVICEPMQDQNPNLAIAWEHSYLPYDDFGLGVYKPVSTYERLLRETGFKVLSIVPRDANTIHCVIVAQRIDVAGTA